VTGFPPVHGGKGHAEAAGQLLLAQSKAAAQESKARRNRIRFSRTGLFENTCRGTIILPTTNLEEKILSTNSSTLL